MNDDVVDVDFDKGKFPEAFRESFLETGRNMLEAKRSTLKTILLSPPSECGLFLMFFLYIKWSFLDVLSLHKTDFENTFDPDNESKISLISGSG